MPDTLHLADSDDSGGFALARLISRLGVQPHTPATFLWNDRGDLSKAWSLWLENWFVPHLAGTFVKVYSAAAQFRPENVQAADKHLDTVLTAALRKRSLLVAKAFLEGKSEMRANREWTRFVERIERGDSPGHATTLFALQCALYHLPLAPALSAYAWFELESGLPQTGYRDRDGSAGEVLAVFQTALPHVSVALRGDHGENDGDDSRLRAI